jgi:hypothetical protein
MDTKKLSLGRSLWCDLACQRHRDGTELQVTSMRKQHAGVVAKAPDLLWVTAMATRPYLPPQTTSAAVLDIILEV